MYVRLLMRLNPSQICPYPYSKSPNYHPPRPTPSAQCPNPPQPKVTMENDMRLTYRSTTIAPQPVPTRLCCQPNPLQSFHSVTRFHPFNSTRIKTHPKNTLSPAPLTGVLVTPSCSPGSGGAVRAGRLEAGRGEHRHRPGGGGRGQGGRAGGTGPPVVGREGEGRGSSAQGEAR
jgi:hypothetical protein